MKTYRVVVNRFVSQVQYITQTVSARSAAAAQARVQKYLDCGDLDWDLDVQNTEFVEAFDKHFEVTEVKP